MLNLLFVSVAFPPKSDPECLQTAKYFRYLQQDESLSIEVVTSAIPTLYMSYDPMLESYATGFTNRVEVRLRENKWMNILRSRLKLQETVFPDPKESFHQQAAKVLKNIKKKPDVIYSRSFPLSSAILAWKLNQHFKVPWVLHLSDPWADSPLHHWSAAYKQKQQRWEERCVTAATYVCLTSMATLSFYTKKYPHQKAKFLYFPNVYEKSIPTAGPYPDLDKLFDPAKLNMVYTGGMALDRSPAFFLEPIRKLLADKLGLKNKLHIIFAGEADHANRLVFEKYALDCVTYLGKVSFTEAQYLQRKADLLLVIDNPLSNPEMAMFFPSKLLDYMIAQKRILAITTKGSATEDIMKDLKGEVFNHKEAVGISNAVLQAVSEKEKANSVYFQTTILPEKYDAGFNAARLANLLKSTVNV